MRAACGAGQIPDKEVVLSREKVLGQEACPEQGAALNGEIVLDRRALPGWRMVLRRVKLRERRSVLRQEVFLGGEIVLSQGRRLEGALYPGTGIVSSRGRFSSRWSVCAAERGFEMRARRVLRGRRARGGFRWCRRWRAGADPQAQTSGQASDSYGDASMYVSSTDLIPAVSGTAFSMYGRKGLRTRWYYLYFLLDQLYDEVIFENDSCTITRNGSELGILLYNIPDVPGDMGELSGPGDVPGWYGGDAGP